MERTLPFLLFGSPLQRFYKFLLKRVIGNFLQSDLDLHQFDVQLGKGEIELRDLELNVQALNELCANLPITIIRASIRLVRVTIPWRHLLTSSCVLRLDGWDLVVVPSEQAHPKASDSFSSMLIRSVMSVNGEHDDPELQRTLALIGQHSHSPVILATAMSASDECEAEGKSRCATLTTAGLRETRCTALGDALDQEVRRVTVADIQVGSDDERTEEEAAEEAAGRRKHTQRQAAALDTAKDGLKVVASFLERVVSAIELEVTDVRIRIQHQPRHGSKQTTLSVSLSRGKLEDRDKACVTEEDASASAATSSSSPARVVVPDGCEDDANSETDATNNLNIGPKYEYNKILRFHGFRVELQEEPIMEDSVKFPSSHSSISMISTLSEESSDHDSSPEAQTILSSSRNHECMLTLKMRLHDTLRGEARLESALFIESVRALLTPRQLALLSDMANAIGISAKQVAVHAQMALQACRIDQPEPAVVAPPREIVNMWNLEMHVMHGSLTLMQSDEQTWPTDWWNLDSPIPSLHGAGIVQSCIPGVAGDHVLLGVHQTFLGVHQTSAESTLKLTLGEIQVTEYLVQRALLPHVTEKEDWMGFNTHPLIAFSNDVSPSGFEQATRSVAEPHLTIDSHASVDSLHSQSFETHPQGTISSHLTLNCQPVTVFFDLGVDKRLKALVTAITAPCSYLHGISDMSALDAGTHNPSFAQIVVLAPSIRLHVLFPATTASQLQPHPYPRMEMLPQSRFLDARGVLRPEQIVCELRTVSISNEVEVAPTSSARGTEWLIKFQWIEVLLDVPGSVARRLFHTNYPSLHADACTLTAGCVRILTRAAQGMPDFLPEQLRQDGQRAEEMFYDALPHVRFWETQLLHGQHRACHTGSASPRPEAAPSHATEQSDADAFEHVALSDSSVVVSVRMPAASIHISKSDYDMLLFLTAIYLDVYDDNGEAREDGAFEMPDEYALHAARSFAQEFVHPDSMSSSLEDDAHDHEASPPCEYDGLTGHEITRRAAGTRSHSRSISSDSSSEMFESVIGMDTVILKPCDERHSGSGPDVIFPFLDDSASSTRRLTQNSLLMSRSDGSSSPGACELLEQESLCEAPNSTCQGGTVAASIGPPTRAAFAFRHAMSLRLEIIRASVVLQEDIATKPLDLATPDPPQFFHADIGELRLFQVVEYNRQPLQYLTVRAGDLTLREYQMAFSEERQLFTTPSMPILFGTAAGAAQEEDEAEVLACDDDSANRMAWENPVLLLNFVIKLNAVLDVRTTQAVVNLRALTWQFFPESKWIQKLTMFFKPTTWVTPIATMLPVQAPPHFTRDIIHVHLHAFDVALDYNPLELPSRVVVALDHVHLQTTVSADATLSTLHVEMRDMAVYMSPNSIKSRYGICTALTELGPPFLHRVSAATLFTHLESLGCVRIATLDVLDVVVTQKQQPSVPGTVSDGIPHVPALAVDVHNGTLTLLTCNDSFNIFVALASHFAHSVFQAQQVAEVDVQFREEAAKFSTAPTSAPPRDILDELDHNAFSTDSSEDVAHHAHSSGPLGMRINGVHLQTPLSLALQAAAEREIEHMRHQAPGITDDVQLAFDPSPNAEQSSIWFAPRDEMMAQEHREQHSAPLIIEDHVPLVDEVNHSGRARFQPPANSPLSTMVLSLVNLSVIWRMFGGMDWAPDSNRVRENEFASAYGDVFLPRGHRQTDRMMELVLGGVNVRFDSFSPGHQMASRLVVALDNVAVRDLITTSTFNNFLCHYSRHGDRGRELGSSMLRLDLTSVRPDPNRSHEEFRMCLSVLPLRLNVDQAALDFFIEYFKPPDPEVIVISKNTPLADTSGDDEDDALQVEMAGPFGSFRGATVPPMPNDWVPAALMQRFPDLVSSVQEAYRRYYDTLNASLLSIAQTSNVEPWRPSHALLMPFSGESLQQYHARMLSAARDAARVQLKQLNPPAVHQVDNQTYIQSFDVTHAIVLCIDWQPHTFDLRGFRAGDYAQLVNLLPLENVELVLKPTKLTGIAGFNRVAIELAQLWAVDVSRYQVHKYLAGVQPIRSVVNVGGGVADLVLLPLAHYRQHGSIKRGVQCGLSSFLRNASLESLSTAARLAQGAQTILESLDGLLAYRPPLLPPHAHMQFTQQRGRNVRKRHGGPVADAHNTYRHKATNASKRADPPVSASEGLRQAYESLSRGMQSAASQMIAIPRDEYQRSGCSGALRSAFQAMPGAVLSPMISGLEAVAKVLNGGASSLSPSRIEEHKDKFKPHKT